MEGWKVGPNGSQNDTQKGTQNASKTLPELPKKGTRKRQPFGAKMLRTLLNSFGFCSRRPPEGYRKWEPKRIRKPFQKLPKRGTRKASRMSTKPGRRILRTFNTFGKNYYEENYYGKKTTTHLASRARAEPGLSRTEPSLGLEEIFISGRGPAWSEAGARPNT